MSAAQHLRASLALVALFLASGLWLEARLGLRIAGAADDPLLREFLRLGHAHGGVLGLVNVGLGLAMGALATPEAWARRIRPTALVGAALVGAGFVIGGLTHGPTDPGPAVLAVPAGAMAMLSSLVAAALVRRDDAPPPGS